MYYIAFSKGNLDEVSCSLIPEIIYIGVSNDKKGVGNRLNAFEKAMRGKQETHGGADRVRVEHENPDVFFQNTYVSIKPFPLE